MGCQDKCITWQDSPVKHGILPWTMASLVDQMVKNLPAMWENQEDLLEKGMATHYSILT